MFNAFFTPLRVPALVLSLATVGCVKTGNVVVSQPLHANLAQYEALVVAGTGKTGDLSQVATNMERFVANRASSESMFKAVRQKSQDGTAPLELRMTVVEYQGGNKGARFFNAGGEAQITVECQLVDLAQDKILTAFTATGNSARKSKVYVAGVDTSVGDNLEGRAMAAAADEIVVYLQQKK